MRLSPSSVASSPTVQAPIDQRASRALLLAEPTIAQPLKLVALGDSSIYGYGDLEGGGWVERLRRRWMDPEAAGPVLYNLGVRGDTVVHVTQRFEFEFSQRGELRNRLPDGLILSVGINDSARLGKLTGRTMTPADQFEVQIHELLDRAVALGPVWFVGMVPVDEARMPFLNCLHYNHRDQAHYRDLCLAACAARSVPYLDLFELWRVQPAQWLAERRMADGLHPNSLGYATILEQVLAWEPIKRICP
jgi:lysophospholipase L1-like esterase